MGVKRIIAKVLGRAVTWNKLPFGTAIVAAAGSSERMEGEDKLFADLCGLPVLGWSLRALEASPNVHEIIVVTPLVTEEIVADAFSKAYKYNAACPGVPVNDTVKRVSDGFVTDTPDRSAVYAVQTPQVFSADVLKASLHNAKIKKLKITDDCGAAEAIGIKPAVSLGSYENIKITRPVDLKLAEAIIEARRAK